MNLLQRSRGGSEFEFTRTIQAPPVINLVPILLMCPPLVYLGIDVSKATLDCHVLGVAFSVLNTRLPRDFARGSIVWPRPTALMPPS